jgi:hypothetical protein
VLHISLLTLQILLITVSFHLYPRKLTFSTLKLELNFLNVINYGKTDGLAMGAPTSSVEHKQIYPVLIKQQINGYFRYVDDMFIIYDQNKTSIENTHSKFNKRQPFIKFSTEKVLRESISYLDLTIHRENKNLKFSVCRKPTQIDIIIFNS